MDDFAIACDSEDIAKGLINAINDKMTVQIKYLGLLTRFNGVDIDQTSDYIKIHNNTYVEKIIKGHSTWMNECTSHTFPVPMKSEASY